MNLEKQLNCISSYFHQGKALIFRQKSLLVITSMLITSILTFLLPSSESTVNYGSQLQVSTVVDSTDAEGIYGVATIDANNFYASYVDKGGKIEINKYSKSQNGSWSSEDVSISASASHSPALSIFKDTLTIIYREKSSSGDDKKLYMARQDASKDNGWAGPNAINGMEGGYDGDNDENLKGKARAKTDHRPSITNYANQLWVFDKNNTKHFIAECVYDGSTWASNSNETTWQKDKDKKDEQQEDWGYQTTPAGTDSDNLEIKNQTLTQDGYNPQTPRDPSTTVYNNRIYLAYKGGVYASDSDDEIMYIMNTTGNYIWSNVTILLNGFTSKYAPAITSIGNQMICVFSNANEDNKLYYSILTDGAWSYPLVLIEESPHGSKGDPELTTLSNSQVLLSYQDSNGQAKLLTLDFN